MPSSLSQPLATIMLEDVAAPLGSNGHGGRRRPASALLGEADAINEATGTPPLLSTS